MSTPYETLCENYRVSREAYFNDEHVCFDLANEIWKSLATYLGLPPDKDGFPSHKLLLLNPNHLDKPQDGGRLLSPGAVVLEKDSFWHFSLGLLVEEGLNTFPKTNIIVNFNMKPYDRFLVLRADGFGKSFFKFERSGKFVDRNSELKEKMKRTCNRIAELINQAIKSEEFFKRGKDEFIVHDGL